MFGKGKKPEAQQAILQDAVKLASEQIAPLVLDAVSMFCSRVLYLQASQRLRDLAVRIDTADLDHPIEEIDRVKADLFSNFCAEGRDWLPPLYDQLKADIREIRGPVEMTSLNLVVDQIWREQTEAIVQAASYVCGISPRYFKEITGSAVVTPP